MIKFFCGFFLGVSLLFCVQWGYAAGKYSDIGAGLTLYSEYYPNPNTSFKGTIIFETGSDTSLEARKENTAFFNCAKKQGSLFLYDRNGLGKSPPDLNTSVDHPITAKLTVEKLLKLLKQRKIRPPYILVSHSYGGLYAGYFAKKYPQMVKAMLMVDPQPAEFEWRAGVINMGFLKKFSKISSRELYSKYSFEKAKKQHISSSEVFYQVLGSKKTQQQLAALPSIRDDIPVIILSSSAEEGNPDIQGDWFIAQKEWLNKNSNSKIILLKSSHFIQHDHPLFVCNSLSRLVRLVNK